MQEESKYIIIHIMGYFVNSLPVAAIPRFMEEGPRTMERYVFYTALARYAPPQSGLTPCQLPRRGSFFGVLHAAPVGRGT